MSAHSADKFRERERKREARALANNELSKRLRAAQSAADASDGDLQVVQRRRVYSAYGALNMRALKGQRRHQDRQLREDASRSDFAIEEGGLGGDHEWYGGNDPNERWHGDDGDDDQDRDGDGDDDHYSGYGSDESSAFDSNDDSDSDDSKDGAGDVPNAADGSSGDEGDTAAASSSSFLNSACALTVTPHHYRIVRRPYMML